MKQSISGIFVMLLLFTVTPHAQGQGGTTVNFSNLDITRGVNAPFYDADGVTRLSGPNFLVALFWGPTDDAEGMLQVGPAQRFGTGGQAGYWVPATRTIPSPSAGPIFVQVRFWDSQGGTLMWFEQAYAARAKVGFSDVFQIMPDPFGQPTPLRGLRSTSLIGVFPLLALGETRSVVDVMAVPNGLQFSSLCAQPVGRMRWFHLTFANPGEALIETQGSSIDTVLSVFTSCLLSANKCAPVACDQSKVHFTAETNILYAVGVGGLNGATGTLQMTFSLSLALSVRTMPDKRVEISWLADATEFSLEVTTNIASAASWDRVWAMPTVASNRNWLWLPPDGPCRFYRLKRNAP